MPMVEDAAKNDQTEEKRVSRVDFTEGGLKEVEQNTSLVTIKRTSTYDTTNDTKSVAKEEPRKVSKMDMKKLSSASAMPEKSTSRLKMRKSSLGMSQIHGIKGHLDRMSTIGLEFKRPVLVYLPTYQLEPLRKFNICNVKRLLEQTLDEEFTGHVYNETNTPAFAIQLATTVLRKVKSFRFDRYRILAVVTIGQKRGQSFNNAVSVLWDPDRDAFVEVHGEVPTCFIQVTVFGIYLD